VRDLCPSIDRLRNYHLSNLKLYAFEICLAEHYPGPSLSQNINIQLFHGKEGGLWHLACWELVQILTFICLPLMKVTQAVNEGWDQRMKLHAMGFSRFFPLSTGTHLTQAFTGYKNYLLILGSFQDNIPTDLSACCRHSAKWPLTDQTTPNPLKAVKTKMTFSFLFPLFSSQFRLSLYRPSHNSEKKSCNYAIHKSEFINLTGFCFWVAAETCLQHGRKKERNCHFFCQVYKK